jgi:peptidoglycan hydrolase FlgJ
MSASASSLFSQALAPLPQPKVTSPKAAHGATPETLKKTAKDFETSMISALLKPMFDGLSTAAPFGGGEAEGTFRSFLVDAMAKQVSKAGGLNLAGSITAELVRMQAGGGK